MNKKLSELVAELRAQSEESPVYILIAERLQSILEHYGVFEELYECGCPVDEFGCQGFHGC